MDGYYTNKKYLQNSNANDYYRVTNIRPQSNEYASYHNTMSRRSLFGGAYPCTKYKYSYPSDVSLQSTYGYTSASAWGLWRDTGNLSPSVYSKKRINIRSFSILIMSAAFIVLLAVLSVAAFAFYFSTFKSDASESMLVFDCAFRISKGDLWTSQLKYNHTSAFRQKAAFYTKFIESSLEHGNFDVAKIDINSFGDGPSLTLNFRIYLDMRKIQMTITNVEEHIKNSLISETSTSDSAFQNLKIIDDSIEIKRQLDPEIIQRAALFNEEEQMRPMMSTTVLPLDEIPNASKKIISSTEKSRLKSPSTTQKSFPKKKDSQRVVHESDIDMDNLPVIQGSFEITKTDADIAQKRSSNARPASTVSLAHSTLKPFYLSPASAIKIKSSIPTTTARPVKTNASGDNILELFFKHQKLMNATELPHTTTTTTIIVGSSTIETATSSTRDENLPPTVPAIARDEINQTSVADIPKLDTNLFTTAPILDEEPWRPINPSNPLNKVNYVTTTEQQQTQRMPEYRNKNTDTMHFDESDSDKSVFYQSFHNADFSGSSLEIEKLGNANVKPYPLPVNKIDVSEEVNVPDFKPLEGKFKTSDVNYDESKFEHLGGGVIAKKPDVNETVELTTMVVDAKNSSDSITTFDSIFQELVNETNIQHPETSTSTNVSSEEELITESIPLTTEKLNFLNMKDFIVQRQNKTSSTPPPSENAQKTQEPQLFPSISKWEFVNGTASTNDLNITKKVFNETLQAVIVENAQSSLSPRIDDIKANRTTDKANIQQLSSIFDTLAAKLGLKPELASKIPPFSQQSHNKLKQSVTRVSRPSTKPKITTVMRTTLKPAPSSTTPENEPTNVIKNSSEFVAGQVEAVDPTKYEEILSMMSTPFMKISSTTPSLVTLMPVKSNVGIRYFNPRLKTSGQNEKTDLETVVKASMSFDA